VSEKPKTRWWQFSLINLLALVVAASFWAAWLGVKSELAESQRQIELEKEKTRERDATIGLLRKEFGYVNVRDESKVHVFVHSRILHENEKMTWSWHLHLPKGRYRLIWATGEIKETGVPDIPLKRWSIPLPVSGVQDSPVQFDVDLLIRRNLTSESCLILKKGRVYPQTFFLSDIELKSLQSLVHANGDQQRGMPTVTASPDDGPIDLLRIVSSKESILGLLVYVEVDRETTLPNPSVPAPIPPKE